MLKRILRVLSTLYFCLLASVFIGSCSNPTVPLEFPNAGTPVMVAPVFAFTDNVDDEQRADFILGVEKWDNALNGSMFWWQTTIAHLNDFRKLSIYSNRCEPMIIVDVVDDDHPEIVKRDKMTPDRTTLGLTEVKLCGITHIWLVGTRLTTKTDFINVSAHEFGHALNANHVPTLLALMSDFYDRTKNKGCVTRDDAVAICRGIHCRTKDVRTCD